MIISLIIFIVFFWYVFLKMIKQDLERRGQNEELINNMNRYDNDRRKKENKMGGI